MLILLLFGAQFCAYSEFEFDFEFTFRFEFFFCRINFNIEFYLSRSYRMGKEVEGGLALVRLREE